MSRATTAARKPPTEAQTAEEKAIQEFEAATLAGDVQTRLLDWFKDEKKIWTAMSEREQRDVIENMRKITHQVVGASIRITASRGFEFVEASIGSSIKVDVKTGIMCPMILSNNSEHRDFVCENQGMPILVVNCDRSDYMGERKKAEPDVVGDLKIPKEKKPARDTAEQKLLDDAAKLEKQQKDAAEAGAHAGTGELPKHDAPAVGDLANPPPPTSSSEPPAPDAAASSQAPLVEQPGTFVEHQPG